MNVTLGPASRLVAAWREVNKARSWIGNAKAYARAHGAAGALRADGSYVLFFMKGKGLHRKTFPSVTLVSRQLEFAGQELCPACGGPLPLGVRIHEDCKPS